MKRTMKITDLATGNTNRTELVNISDELLGPADKITIELTDSWRGLVRAYITCPGEAPENVPLTKYNDLWHAPLRLLAERVEAWLRAANKLHLTQYHIRRLRKTGKISFPAPTRERMRSFWKEVHTARKGMWQRPGSPNLANV